MSMHYIVKEIMYPTPDDVISGYEKQIARLENQIQEIRDRINQLKVQSTLASVVKTSRSELQ